jgi:hypothetical protein
MVNNDIRNFFILLLINQLQPAVVVAAPTPAPVDQSQPVAPVDQSQPVE